MIVSCEIAPGSKLNERQLIERLGFGRTPIREALLRLDQDRLLDTIPRSGYRVKTLSSRSVSDFFDVWRVVAPLIVRLAVPRFSQEIKGELEALGEERERTASDDMAEMSRIAGAFFDILVKAAANDPLTYIFNHLGAEMERIFQLFFSSEDGRRWLSTGPEIAGFSRMVNPETAVRLIEERLRASEVGSLAVIRALEAAQS